MHRCHACLITCQDFRLHQRKDGRNYIAEFIKNLDVDCDLITRAGGILDLVRPAKDNHDHSILRDTGVSAELHQVETAYLLNHETCGAYNSIKFYSRDEELKQHSIDLQKAKEKILENFPNVKVKMFFAELEQGTADVFKIKEV
ncbi:MAG: carbonic anhydrase [bacterium]